MVLALRDDVREVAQDPQILLIPVVHDRQRQVGPGRDDRLQRLLELELAAGVRRDLRDGLLVIEDAIGFQHAQVHVRARRSALPRQVHQLEDLLPVAGPHGRIPEIHDDWHVLPPGLDHDLSPHGDLVAVQRLGEVVGHAEEVLDRLVHALAIDLGEVRRVPLLSQILPLCHHVPQLVLLVECLAGLRELLVVEVAIRGWHGTKKILVLPEGRRLLLGVLDLLLVDLVEFLQHLAGILDLLGVDEATLEQLLVGRFRVLLDFEGALVSLLDHGLVRLIDVALRLEHLSVGKVRRGCHQLVIDNRVLDVDLLAILLQNVPHVLNVLQHLLHLVAGLRDLVKGLHVAGKVAQVAWPLVQGGI
mmetsp:Transcript_13597/g.34383  ORF Transcript_13597/g.34383 Transcript_13597/m.34383 type:complete len:360 (+) Transcript_13597:3477-4556(+)